MGCKGSWVRIPLARYKKADGHLTVGFFVHVAQQNSNAPRPLACQTLLAGNTERSEGPGGRENPACIGRAGSARQMKWMPVPQLRRCERMGRASMRPYPQGRKGARGGSAFVALVVAVAVVEVGTLVVLFPPPQVGAVFVVKTRGSVSAADGSSCVGAVLVIEAGCAVGSFFPAAAVAAILAVEARGAVFPLLRAPLVGAVFIIKACGAVGGFFSLPSVAALAVIEAVAAIVCDEGQG